MALARLEQARGWLAILLVGLLLALSAAPCTSTAVAASTQPVMTAPFDPCHGATPAPAIACAQLACQTLMEPASAAASDCKPSVEPARFHSKFAALSGQHDAPDDPPPRAPMN